MEEEIKSFTETAVLFSLTGHVFIREDASDEYCTQCISEIRDDAVYKHVMSNVPKSLLKSVSEMCDSYNKDVDPILEMYLCQKFPKLLKLKNSIVGVPIRKASAYVCHQYLTNGYEEISPITFDEFEEVATKVDTELNGKSKNKV